VPAKENLVLLLAVTIISLAMLFLLTTFALGAVGEISHPVRVTIVLVAALLIGAAILYEYGSAA